VVQLVLAGMEKIHTVLDVGTGSGIFAEQFAASGLQVTGLDANPVMLPEARKFVPAGTFQEGAAEKLPFPDRSFDLVFIGLLLHETDDALVAMYEAHRVLTQRLAILEWQYEQQPFGPPLEHRISGEKVTTLAGKAGFKKVIPLQLDSLVLYLVDR
jgi:ubiquinone/menaquinone biosynthesis C-methylase UbiE